MKIRKSLILVVFFMAVSYYGITQSTLPPMDKSPMDMCYFPVDYPVLKIQHKADAPLIARIIYGRPQKNNRSIFGDLVPYDMIWRMGANEATELELYKDVLINNKVVAKGRYTLYAIPLEDKWTIIVNKETDIWGAFKYDSGKDVVRMDVPVQKQAEPLEAFTMFFEKATIGTGFNMIASWDTALIALPITVYEKPLAKKTVKKK